MPSPKPHVIQARSQPTFMGKSFSPPFPSPSILSPPSSPLPPLRSRSPIFAARDRVWGSLSALPAGPDGARPPNDFGELYAKNRACSSNGLEEFYKSIPVT